MTSNQFCKRFVIFNISFLFLIGVLNFCIDAKSFHHPLGAAGWTPRTTENSFLSKLNYLSNNHFDTIYFGSSRTEVGLPPYSYLVGDGLVYNAGVTGLSFGQIVPFVNHSIFISQPKQVVIGIDFFSFSSSDNDGNKDFNLSLLTGDLLSYFIKRNIYEFSNALSFYAIENSIKSIVAKYNGVAYDGMNESLSFQGQRTEAKMRSMIEDQGKGNKAFRRTIYEISKGNFLNSANQESIYKLNGLVKMLCEKKVSTKIYIHPVHALLIDVLRQKGLWPKLEKWKLELANIASFYQDQNCAINVLDFSGYNSITTESVKNLSESKTLKYYWEASHYKSNVGELILKRIFSINLNDVPEDFGRELRNDTIVRVLSEIKEEQLNYLATHVEDIQFTQE